jgi:uncharacterized protein (DUF2141 family)
VRNRRRAVFLVPAAAALIAAAAPAPAPATPPGDVTIAVTGLRSGKGQVLACLTSRADAFPDCARDPQARKLTVPATEPLQLDFGPVPAGHYAVSLIHDENGNGKLDTRLFIPREGFGFSRDAPVVMGPPKFDRAAFAVEGANIHLAIRMRYLL